jgi:hypothetical protein
MKSHYLSFQCFILARHPNQTRQLETKFHPPSFYLLCLFWTSLASLMAFFVGIHHEWYPEVIRRYITTALRPFHLVHSFNSSNICWNSSAVNVSCLLVNSYIGSTSTVFLLIAEVLLGRCFNSVIYSIIMIKPSKKPAKKHHVSFVVHVIWN